MKAAKIYFPVDAADVYRVPSTPRPVPPLLDEMVRRDVRRHGGLILACGLGAVALLALAPDWWRAAVVVPVALALLGLSSLRAIGRRREVWRDGEAVLARVSLLAGDVHTEIRYVEQESDVTGSGDVGVFAGEPGTHAIVEYEFGGRVHEVRMNLAETGKPIAVRVGDKLGCAAIVLPANPNAGILVTSRLVRSSLKN